jgi:CO dehydrogenase maturation factor
VSALIAVSGKGGVGKTAVAAGLVKCLGNELKGPILAVDADPNSTLGEALGLPYEATLADVREQRERPEGIAKADLVRLGVEQALVEGEGVDLLVMGRPEGPGCYCAVNHILRDSLRRVGRRYQAVVVDNEAGMEHLSRRTAQDIAVLLVVAGPTAVSLKAAGRVLDLAERERLPIGRRILVLNRWERSAGDELGEAADSLGVDGRATLPHSAAVARVYASGASFAELDPLDPFLLAVRRTLVPPVLEAVRGGNGTL